MPPSLPPSIAFRDLSRSKTVPPLTLIVGAMRDGCTVLPQNFATARECQDSDTSASSIDVSLYILQPPPFTFRIAAAATAAKVAIAAKAKS